MHYQIVFPSKTRIVYLNDCSQWCCWEKYTFLINYKRDIIPQTKKYREKVIFPSEFIVIKCETIATCIELQFNSKTLVDKIKWNQDSYPVPHNTLVTWSTYLMPLICNGRIQFIWPRSASRELSNHWTLRSIMLNKYNAPLSNY